MNEDEYDFEERFEDIEAHWHDSCPDLQCSIDESTGETVFFPSGSSESGSEACRSPHTTCVYDPGCKIIGH